MSRFRLILLGLPGLLELAREILVLAFPQGSPEADNLRRRLEVCVVDAHRLLLSNQIAMLANPSDGGPAGA